jgi:hypothetical protein
MHPSVKTKQKLAWLREPAGGVAGNESSLGPRVPTS